MSGPAVPWPVVAAARLRARGEARAVFARVDARTEPARVYETGGLRLRFPRTRGGSEAVLINTGGGMAGGDRADVQIELQAGAEVLFTTQSAEKIYRTEEDAAEVDARIVVAEGARLEWLPQETILFHNARFVRRLAIDLAVDASLLLVEAVTFGRIAMGERDIDASIHDSWRVRRQGRLVFAEELRLDHAAAALDRIGVGRGARAIATILIAAPDPQAQLEKLRTALDEAQQGDDAPLEGGATAFEGLALARLISPSPARLRAALVAVMIALRGRAAPRVWT
jgi:urease accessory protein